jgi:hypothetical protein
MFEIKRKELPTMEFDPDNMYIVMNTTTSEIETVLVTSFEIEGYENGCIFMGNGTMAYGSKEYLERNYSIVKKIESITID